MTRSAPSVVTRITGRDATGDASAAASVTTLPSSPRTAGSADLRNPPGWPAGKHRFRMSEAQAHLAKDAKG
ncbi:hypothetical protein [Nonomuraea insulae]|uniref:Uncharacterized protein n=1 Tax=Nonomuraea insulae TaxID=1616787 RepID=A0ABW1CSL3_9ACTN